MKDIKKLTNDLFEIADELYAREISGNCVYPESWSQFGWDELVEKAQKILTKLEKNSNNDKYYLIASIFTVFGFRLGMLMAFNRED